MTDPRTTPIPTAEPHRLAYLLVAFAAACATPVEPTALEMGFEAPERFAASGSDAEDEPPAEPPDRWWCELDSPALTATVEQALTFNRNLHASAARLQAAVARAEIAGANLYPQLAAGLDTRRGRVNFIGLPIGGGGGVFSTTNTTIGLSLNMTWEIDLWGRIRAGKLGAERDLEAAAADFRGARLSLAARTAHAWFTVIEARQQLELALDSVDLFRRTENQISSRFEQGVRSALDVRLSRADRVSAEALAEQRRRQVEQARRELQALVGHYPDGDIDPGIDLPAIHGPVPVGLPASLLRRRPDVIGAERRLAAADARLGEARASLYPRLSLTASGGTSSTEALNVIDGDFRVWSIGANLLAPIFEGGRLRANVDLRDAERIEALANWGDSVLRAFREVETALATEVLFASEEERLGESTRQSVAARELSADRYSRGLDDVITLLESQRRALGAQTRLLEVRRLRLDNRVNLLLALGGGFEGAGDVPSTDERASHP